MTDVVTFGEAMLRLAPPGFRRLEQATSLDMTVGGAELNVAAGVTRLGLSATWVSALPENALGRFVLNRAREIGVDVSHIAWQRDGRLGLYFVEYGASPRPSTPLRPVRLHDRRCRTRVVRLGFDHGGWEALPHHRDLGGTQ